jgi:phosphohistidine swiveling domain-containing protein
MIQTFEKSYTRDYSMILEEAWYSAITKGVKNKFSIEMPKISSIFYMNEGIIEIWEDLDSLSLLKTNLLKKINLTKIKQIFFDYNQQLKKNKKQSLQTISDLINFIERTFNLMESWAVLYLVGTNEQSSEEMKLITREFRSQDSFFDDCDKVIRTSLISANQNLRGYESTIIFEDIKTKTPPLDVLKKRKNHFLVVPNVLYEINTLDRYSKDNPDKEFKFNKIDLNTNEIKGEMASSGNVVGKVKIIKRKEQMLEMKEGQILVTPMTTPEYGSVMKKSSAIITDEGGMLCHAAVLARELNKPCIVGTKVATKVFKNGDLVEVDADKGIVRKIK